MLKFKINFIEGQLDLNLLNTHGGGVAPADQAAARPLLNNVKMTYNYSLFKLSPEYSLLTAASSRPPDPLPNCSERLGKGSGTRD